MPRPPLTPRTARRVLCLLTAAVTAAVPTTAAAAQGPALNASGPVRVLETVLAFNRAWLGDSIRVATCPTYVALGRPADFPGALSEASQTQLDLPLAQCGDSARAPSAPWCTVARVTHFELRDSVAVLTLFTRRGEYSHYATYTVARIVLRPPAPELWALRTVIIDRAGQEYPGPRTCTP